MLYTITIEIAATPDAVWPVMADVERWHEWTASITSVTRLTEGPFAVGSRARIRQPRLPPAEWTVTELQAGRGFTWVSTGPLLRVTGRHWIEARGSASLVTLSVTYEGLLGRLVGRMTGELNTRYIGLEAEGLKRRCEGG